MEKWVPKALLSKNIPRFVQFAAAAAQQALVDSGWEGDKTMAGNKIVFLPFFPIIISS